MGINHDIESQHSWEFILKGSDSFYTVSGRPTRVRSISWKCRKCGLVYTFYPKKRRDMTMEKPNYNHMIKAKIEMNCRLSTVKMVLES